MPSMRETLKGVVPRPARSSDAFQRQLVNTLEAHLEGRIAEARDAASRAGDDAVFAGQVVLEALGGLERRLAGLAVAVAGLEAGAVAADRALGRLALALAARHTAGRDHPILDLSDDQEPIGATLALLGHRVVRPRPPGSAVGAHGEPETSGGQDPGLVLVASDSAAGVLLRLRRYAEQVPAGAELLLLSRMAEATADDPIGSDEASADRLPDELRTLLAHRPVRARASHAAVEAGAVGLVLLGPAAPG